jgi:MFS family permease
MVRNLIQNFSIGLVSQFQSIYITALGASPMQLGYVSSLGGIAGALAPIPAGSLADKYGIKRILMPSILLMSLGYLVFGIANSWQATALALVISGIGWQIAMTVCPMICGSTLKSVERVTGMQLCDTLSAVPRLVAPLVSAFLIARFGGMSADGIRPLFLIVVIGLMISGFVFYKYFNDPVRTSVSQSSSLLVGLRKVFNEGRMVKRWIVYGMISVLPWYLAVYIPLFAKEVKNANPFTIGLMDAGYWLVSVLLSIPVGLTADRFGRKRLIMLMTPLYSLSMMLLVYASNSMTLVIVGLLSGFMMLATVTEWAIGVELVPQELLGTWFGIIGLTGGIVMIFAPILGGFLWNYLGPEYVLFTLSLSQIVKLPLLASMPSSITKN